MSRVEPGSRRRWIRVPTGGRETLGAAVVAGALAAGVGVATFYLTRILLAREPLEGPPGLPERTEPEAGGGAGGA